MSKRHRLLVLVVILTSCSGEASKDAPSDLRTEQPKRATPTSVTTAPVSPRPFAGKVVRLNVAGGKVTPERRAVEVPVGQAVRIELTADVNDEIHVHAYDKKQAVKPGEIAVLDFTADIPGSFEVELEKSGLELFELKVQ